MKRNPKSQAFIDRINNIGLTVDPDQLREAIMNRIREIDGGIAGVLLMIVEFDNPDDPVHETGVSVEDTLKLYEQRRNRLLDYLTADLSEDTAVEFHLPPDDQPTMIVPPEQGETEE